MDGQGELLPTRPLHEAIRPKGGRDEQGTMGEALCQLADALERHFPAVVVKRLATPAEVWSVVDDTAKLLLAEEAFRSNHDRALSRLRQLANV